MVKVVEFIDSPISALKKMIRSIAGFGEKTQRQIIPPKVFEDGTDNTAISWFFCGSGAFELYPAPCSAPLLSAGCQLPVLLLGGQRPPAGTGFGCGDTGHMGLRAGDRQMPDRSRAGDFPAFGGVHLCGAFVLLQILEPVGG